MTPVEILTAARDLVARGWCQGTMARTRHGCPTAWTLPDAASFCSVGAVQAAAGASEGESVYEAFEFFADVIDRARIPKWNDAPGRTQAEVVAAFDRAIELAKAEVQP